MPVIQIVPSKYHQNKFNICFDDTYLEQFVRPNHVGAFLIIKKKHWFYSSISSPSYCPTKWNNHNFSEQENKVLNINLKKVCLLWLLLASVVYCFACLDRVVLAQQFWALAAFTVCFLTLALGQIELKWIQNGPVGFKKYIAY